MSINFPTTLDTLANPAAGDALNSPSHATQHANANDILEALEAKVGVDSSAVNTSHDFKLSGVATGDKAVSKTGAETLTNKTLTSPIINLASNATGDIYYRDAGGAFQRLPIGSADQILKVASGIPSWVDNPNSAAASTTVKGVVEEATLAEALAGTATGGTGARLFVNPSSLVSLQTYSVGALPSLLVKTYFNMQLPFTLWTGAVANDTTTTFVNWVRNSADIAVAPMGTMINAINTGADDINLNFFNSLLNFNATNILVLDFWAKFPATGTGDITMGFTKQSATQVYNSTGDDRVAFCQRGSTGVIYATCSKDAVGVTNTVVDVTGITITNWNNYRIEYDLSNNALFYVNGVLKATIATNIPVTAAPVLIAFGRSDTALFQVTAPTLSMQMNP